MLSAIRHLSSAFPFTRMRRTRAQDWCRALLAEHQLSASDLILPLFVQEGHNEKTAIDALPNHYRLSIDNIVKAAQEASSLGIKAVVLFPVIDVSLKSEYGDEAINPDNLMCRTIKALKKEVPHIGVIADVALDPYTSHGQDGIVKNGVILNDETVAKLCDQSLALAQAGCDIVAPSDMMDGRIGAIRNALETHGYSNTMILSYAAKYASSLYGPFRQAVGSATALGAADKKTYQMSPTNSDEAMKEIALDISEGADMIMVKPGLAYLDIISRATREYNTPLFAYHVSGEYAMIHAAAEKGWVDAPSVLFEHTLALKRAGARAIITYAALELAKELA